MQWINFLHLYQPGNAEAATIREATDKSYLRIVRALEENNKINFTLNINGCLVSRWEDVGNLDIIRRLKALYERGQVELVGTASYHPLLPLITAEETRGQILDNEKILKKYFGQNLRLRGFFLPEMAYSLEVAKIVRGLGYEYLILDEIAYNGKIGAVDINKIYEDSNSGLKIVFRSREISQSYVPETIYKHLNGGPTTNRSVIITATDGELYGLRHNDPEGLFEACLKRDDLTTKTVSEFIKDRGVEKISVVSCSWESTEEELENKIPYAIWSDKNNPLHTALWRLANLAQTASHEFKFDKNIYWNRWHLVRGLASCTFWWASGKDFRSVFGPVAWNPDLIAKGANEMIFSIRSLKDKKSRRIKIKAEKLFTKIIELTWIAHWRNHWAKRRIMN